MKSTPILASIAVLARLSAPPAQSTPENNRRDIDSTDDSKSNKALSEVSTFRERFR